MFRPLSLVPILLCAACGPTHPPTIPIDESPALTSPGALWRNFRDNRDAGQYTGRRVQVVLSAGSYEKAPGGINWWSDNNRRTMPPTIVFGCLLPPTDGKADLIVVGIVRGRVSDGKRRIDGTAWYVLVTDCTISQLPITSP